MLLETLRAFTLKSWPWLRYFVFPLALLTCYLIGGYRAGKALDACETETMNLTVQAAKLQSMRDSVFWSARLNAANQSALYFMDQNLQLNEKIRSDSIARMSELAAMRAVNNEIARSRR